MGAAGIALVRMDNIFASHKSGGVNSKERRFYKRDGAFKKKAAIFYGWMLILAQTVIFLRLRSADKTLFLPGISIPHGCTRLQAAGWPVLRGEPPCIHS